MAKSSEVRDALSALSTVEDTYSHNREVLRVAVDRSEAGLFFKAMRENGFDFDAGSVGDTIVAHIEAEETLGDLFG